MSGPKVLIVDDSEIVINWVRTALADFCEVIATRTAVEVAPLAFREKPDLVLLDVKMPVLRGDDIIELVRKSVGDKTSIVLYSALPDLPQIAQSCSADGFIYKSADVEGFVERVRGLLHDQPANTDLDDDLNQVVVVGPAGWFTTDGTKLRGCCTLAAYTNPKAALDAMRMAPVNLLIVGPDESAATLCRSVREDGQLARTPILAVVDRDEDATQCLIAAANIALVRPLEDVDLFDAIARLTQIASRRASRLMIRFECANGFGVGFSRDISASGVLLESDQIMQIGTQFQLRFFLPAPAQRGEVNAHAQVVRIHQREPRCIAGLTFTTITDDDRVALEEFVGAARRAASA